MNAALPYGGRYVPNVWVPMRVEVANDTDQGYPGASVHIAPSEVTIPEFRATLNLIPHTRQRLWMWVYLGKTNKKSASAGSITVHDRGGARLALADLAGNSITDTVDYSANGLPSCGVLLSLSGSTSSAASGGPAAAPSAGGLAAIRNSNATMDVPIEAMKSTGDYVMVESSIMAEEAPRGAAWYAGVYAVQLDHLRPDALDPTQRQALLDYVSAGGVLMLNAPDPTLVAGSWLEPYLPVRMIGTRQMRAIDAVGEATPRPFVGWETCTEAVAAQGAVLLQDAQYVHAAARPLGLGQVVFTSFPASTLDAKDDRNVALWRSLMNCDHRPVGVAGSRISTEYPALMEPMLGKHAAPWSLAAVVACGFVLLAGGAHLLWRGAARPKAFIVSLVMAVLVAATFGVLAAFRQETEPVQQARLSITDAWDGGFQTQEYAALSGPQAPPDKLAQQVVQENATLRPVLSRQDRLVLTQWPARLERLPIQPEQVSVVTLASRIDRSNSGIKASGRFAADGLHLNIDNRMGQPLTSSQLLWRTRRMGLTGVGVGQSQTMVGENTLRPADEYTASPGLVSQDEQHKGEILRSLLTPQQPMMRTSASRATIVGWMRSTPAATTAQGVEISRAAAQNLVRVPVDLEPSAPGDHVRIDGPFNHVVQSGGRGLPYDTIADEFGASTLEGTWAFVMQPPLEVGRVQPTHARISIDLAAPQQIIRLLKGKSAGNATSVLGSWQQATQSQVIEFDVTPADCDAEGRLLLQLSVQHAGAAGTLGVPKPWRVTRFNVDLEGDVVAEKHRP